MKLPSLTSHIPQVTGSASSNWFAACAGVSSNTTSASALEATMVASANPIVSALAATVSVSPAVDLPAGATPLRLTGHTTGTGDNTGLILVSAFEIVAVPWEYNVTFSLTDFPLVCPLALHVHAVRMFGPPSLGLCMRQIFSHMHLCLLFMFHNCKQSVILSCIKGVTITCVHPFRELINTAQCTWMHGRHALRFMHVQKILHQPCSPWSVIAFKNWVQGKTVTFCAVLQPARISHAWLLPCLFGIMYPHWLKICRSQLLP